MDKKLNLLFDYQRFAENEHLGELIERTEAKYASSGIVRLSMDELDISAAGEERPFDNMWEYPWNKP